MVGQIVCSKKGRDKGYFLVIVAENSVVVYVCDGKERPLERPKKKNVKHLSFTNTVLEADCFKSNKNLRKSLAIYKCTDERERNSNV